MGQVRRALALSVDVEDWPQSSWDRSLPLSDYCADDARRLLDLLAEFPGARGTFFILGKFAEKHPGVVRAIAQSGHEIGSHGYGHVELFRLGQKGFAADVKRSTEVISDASGARPVGYRASDFSVVGETLWALEKLAEQGYRYDTSIFPIARARYGIANWPRGAAHVSLLSGTTILEVPLATLELFGQRVPVGGGGYARLMPGPILAWALRKASGQLNFPPVFYCHPYELNWDEFDKIDLKIPRMVRVHQTMGRRKAVPRLRRILGDFACISISEAIARVTNLPTIEYTPYVLKPGDVRRPCTFRGARPV